jgi:hypothetical protein
MIGFKCVESFPARGLAPKQPAEAHPEGGSSRRRSREWKSAPQAGSEGGRMALPLSCRDWYWKSPRAVNSGWEDRGAGLDRGVVRSWRGDRPTAHGVCLLRTAHGVCLLRRLGRLWRGHGLVRPSRPGGNLERLSDVNKPPSAPNSPSLANRRAMAAKGLRLLVAGVFGFIWPSHLDALPRPRRSPAFTVLHGTFAEGLA